MGPGKKQAITDHEAEVKMLFETFYTIHSS